MQIGVPSEQWPGERRVAVVPASMAALKKSGIEVLIESGAGERAGFTDAAYRDKGARTVTRGEAFGADVVLQVRVSNLPLVQSGQDAIGIADRSGRRRSRARSPRKVARRLRSS